VPGFNFSSCSAPFEVSFPDSTSFSSSVSMRVAQATTNVDLGEGKLARESRLRLR
jgi:hypothetical protein